MSDDDKFQELQLIEQNLQNLILQKQAFQLELNETQTALKELQNSKEEVFKIIGNLMIKTEKSKLKEELQNKQKILDLRLKNLEKQEKALTERAEKLRQELSNSLKK